MHHIICDGATDLIIMNEINKYYNDEEVEELEIQYSDYAIHLNEKKKNGKLNDQIEIYKEIFSDEYEILNIPKRNVIASNENHIKEEGINNNNDNNNDNNNNNNTFDDGNTYEKLIDKSTSTKINEFVKNHNISKTALFISIYGYVLSKYSGQDTIYTSLICANRNNHYVENMVGMFVSTLPLLLKYNDEESQFIEIIKETMELLVSIYNNQDVSFSELSDILKLKKVNNSFIFQPNLSNESYIRQDNSVFNIKSENGNKKLDLLYEMEDKIKQNDTYKFDVTFKIIENDDDYLISIKYNPSIYDSMMIKSILNSYIEIINSINNFENNNVKNIEYIPIEEKNRIIKEFNSEENKEGWDKLYHEEFSKIAENYPDRCAIVFNEVEIIYKELDEMSNSLAYYLRSQGVGRNDIIPIICDRSPYYIVGILGISKAGGAFLPIDKNLPNERIQFILEDVNPKIVLYKNCKNVIDNLNNSGSINYNIYNLEEHIYLMNCSRVKNINESSDILYVIFTSGTTGKPKGTMVRHFNIYNYIREFSDEEGRKKDYCLYNILTKSNIQNILSITNFSFDMSHNDNLYPLLHGLKIVLVDDIIYNDITLLSRYIVRNKVEFIKTTPSRMKLFMENEEFVKSISNIKIIMLGGEELSRDLCTKIYLYSNCKIIDSYGPTESSVNCTFKIVNKSDINRITIGKPLCNYKIYILDKYEKPVPIGVEGEIYIAGYGVGKGYLNRPELTKEKFVENPFNFDNDEHNRIMYRTGDLGRWTSEGEIEYLGRIDFQVKIHGQRIELGEIESKVLEIPGIRQCVVIDKKKENGEKYLICYYISSHDEDKLSNKVIREYLNEKLPRYMVPNYYIKLNEIPLSRTGKLNRRGLPEPRKEDLITEAYVAPETTIEKIICKIYSDIFNIELNEVGKRQDFFELGGDSLNAIRISSRIEKELNIKVYIKDIMSHSIIGDLSKHIESIINSHSNDNKNMVEIIEKRHCKEFPVTSQQLGVYIDSLKERNSIIYNTAEVYKLNKNINKEKVKDSLLKIFSKQEILRSKYYGKEINGKTEIFGYIDDECSLKFEEYSYENVGSFIRPFELDKAPLIRVGFIKDEVLLIDMHHIICDGYTKIIIMNELSQYYNDEEVEELEIQYSDYALHLNEKKENGKLNDEIEIYKEIFSNEYEILNIPKRNLVVNNENNIKEDDTNNKYNEYDEVNRYEQIIDKSTSKKINEFIKHHNIIKTALFISIYGYVLSKYSGQDIIYTSVMSANRNNHYIENMAGMFVSTLPLLLKFNNEEKSFIDIIRENMELLGNIYKNQDISFSELTNSLKLKKVNNSFIFQPRISIKIDGKQNESIFYTNSENNENRNTQLNSLFEMENSLKQNNRSRFDITFIVTENKEDYLISIEYNKLMYDSVMIENILNSYIEIIKNINCLEDSNIKIIEYIPLNERNKIIKEFNSNVNKEGCNKIYHEEFSKIAKKYPESCAFVFNETKITYKELDDMSNSLAYYLRSQGVGRNDIIPIICDRSPYYIVGILGISKAGGAFLPIDKNLPIERIQFILEDVNPKIVLYKNCKNVIDNLNNSDSIIYNMYNLEKHNYSLNLNCGKINNINKPKDTCYVIFTSGTTGKPKGALISYYNIYNFIRSYKENNNNGDDKEYCIYDIMMEKINVKSIVGISNFSFDVSLIEILFSIVNGLNLILVDDNTNENIDLLSKYMIENEVDSIQITPSRLKLLMENELFRKTMKQIKSIGLGGEELSVELCKTIKEISNCKIYNQYGPTECTIGCSFKEVKVNSENKITVGKPICNCEIFILDKYMKPVPIGIEGEIYIGGYGVGKGYLNRPELTKEKFIENPFNFDNDEYNRIMYRTGDLGRWTPEGEIEYLGRVDFQVKINGQRVELGEIECKVLEIPGIRQCVVIDKKKENGEKYLVCYYISNHGEDKLFCKNIRKYLSEKLPRYMVPNYYIKINEVPLSSTGKLNRKGLPEPSKEDLITEAYVAPETTIEKIICKIYSDLFNIELKEIGRNHDFYELGGDSLNAIRISSRIEKELNIKVYVKDIMSHPVIYDLSKYIESIMNDENNDTNNIEVIKKRHCKEFPVTSQQLGVYIDSIKERNSIIYNIPNAYRLNKNIDKEKLKDSLLKIFSKQEILRSKYYGKEINGKTEIYGYIDDECSLKFEEYSYENIGSFIRPFELDKAPLIRVGFIKDEVLLIDMHHIICDGITNLIIMNEINQYYYDEEVEELEIQYSDYAINLNEKKENGKLNDQIEIYKEMFSNEYEILNISKRDDVLSSESNGKEESSNMEYEMYGGNDRYEQTIDKSTSKKINEFIKYHNISKTALFISIYGYVLSKYSGQDIIYTSLMSANRNNHYVEHMAGMFVSTLPLLLKYENGDSKFIEIIKETMELLGNIYKNQDLSFAELIEKLKLKKINNSFVFQPYISNRKDGEQNKSIVNIDSKNENMELNSLFETENSLNQNNKLKFDISFIVIEKEDDYLISIEFNKLKYDSVVIENIFNSYNEIIHNIHSLENSLIKTMEYIPKVEKNRIINEFNSDINKEGCNQFYYKEFSKIAEMYPERCAIVFNEIKINYKELDEMSNSLAHYLRSQGVERNDIIPIICDRSPYYIIGILGISKAGGAFLPIDRNLPNERIKFILNDVHPKLVLYKNCKNIIDNLNNCDNITFNIYNLEKHNYSNNCDKINSINNEDDICYVLYTSGTTGNPKGALISHLNLYSNIGSFYNENNEVTNNSCLANFVLKDNIRNILSITNFIFDISHNEITLSLINGLTIILVDDYLTNDVYSLSDYILKNSVEFINTTPSRFKILMENEKFRDILKIIKCIVFIGEELNKNLCKRIGKYSNCKIYNGYGPTEATVTCTYKCVDYENENKISIGKSQCNYNIYILDKYMNPVPIGVEGEIYIGGYGVGKGYLNRPDLTKEKFIENPFNFDNDEHNRIMYRTGDLGKWTSDGEIDYLGRIDFQVKINGHRVELGEIENKVLEIPGIQQCAVIDRKKENGEKYLVCYYILKEEEEEILSKNIRNYLTEKLPRYMVPNYYIRINEIPLSSTGKLNRRGLPEPSKEDLITEVYVAPKTTIEKIICKIYSDLFNIEVNKIGRNYDFYELGGDSLNAIRISSRIEKELNIKVYIKDIMSHPIIYDLSEYIEFVMNDKNNDTNKIEVITKRNCKEFPVTSQQLGVYIDSVKHPNSIIYNIPSVYRLNKNVDKEKIKKSLLKIFSKQEILKSKYYGKEINGKTEIYGYIDEECSLKFEEYSHENIGRFIRPFELDKAPLMRVGFINDEVLLIDMHHIICDGSTMLILMKELNQYYYDEDVEELDIQYSDYAINLNEKKMNGKLNDQIEIYNEIFSNDYEILNIPKRGRELSKEIDDKEENSGNEFNEMNRYEQVIDKSVSEKMNEFIKRHNISKTALFISIYGYVLSKYSGQDIIYTSVMNMNRNNHYVENMAGMFVSTLPLLLKYANEESKFVEIVKENMEILNDVYKNQDISFAELIDYLNLKKVNNSFIFQPNISNEYNGKQDKSIFIKNNDEDNIELNSLNEIKNIMKQNNNSKFDITFSVVENEDNYFISMEYNSMLYELNMIKNILNSYIEIISNIHSLENTTIKDIEYIPINEKERIINEFNSDINKEECNKFYYEEFSEIAEKYPERCAIVFNEIRITYKELNEMSNSLAHYLRSQGVKRNDITPIICDRSPYYIIGILGISKAGGAFLPIDKNLPIERIKFILEDVKPDIILYKNCNDIIENLSHDDSINCNIYNLEKHNYSNNCNKINYVNNQNDVCYVLFTSGTTGNPKGTLISHFNICNYIRKFDDKYQNNYYLYKLLNDDKIKNALAITNFSFDMSQNEI
eukprot:jgi/Orpsp1_1/1192346/evm.model.d7180000092453.1